MSQLLLFYFVNVLSFLFLLFAEIEQLGELFQTILLSNQSFDILLSTFVPVMVYSNVDTDKLQILKDNKGKAGVYLFMHNESGKKYVGSSRDLSRRLRNYFNINHVQRVKSMYICRALLAHGYSSFSVSILNYVDITNLSTYEAKTKILQYEQFFIDTLLPEFNIASTAGSLLGFKHSEETIAKMILAKKDANKGEENPMFGKKTFSFGSPTRCIPLSEGKLKQLLKLVEKIIICSVNYIQLRVPDPMHPPLRGEAETLVKFSGENNVWEKRRFTSNVWEISFC